MAMTFHVDIVSVEAEIYSGSATVLFAPASMGEVGVTPRHTPFLTELKPGEVRIQKQEGEEEWVYVSGGILEVQPHVVTILADTAERARNLDEAEALAAKQRAEEALADRKGKMDYARAEAELADAVAKLRTIDKLRRNPNR